MQPTAKRRKTHDPKNAYHDFISNDGKRSTDRATKPKGIKKKDHHLDC